MEWIEGKGCEKDWRRRRVGGLGKGVMGMGRLLGNGEEVEREANEFIRRWKAMWRRRAGDNRRCMNLERYM